MMKSVTVLIIASLFSGIVFSQSNIRLNNDWTKTYVINPGKINDEYLVEINMDYRKQWVGFKGAPTTLFASGTLFIPNLQTQFGAKVMQDKIGFTSTTNVGLTYSYSSKLSDDWDLGMGLGLNFQSLGYDVARIKSPTPYDPVVLTRTLNESYINSDMGAELKNKFWRIGLSTQNMFSLFSESKKLFPNTNFLYGIYYNPTNQYFNVGYGICAIQYSNILQTEFNLTGYFKSSPYNDPLQLSLIYRTWSEVGMLFGLDLSANLRASYSYDYNFSGISRGSFGTHELMITLRFNKNSVCRHCWY